MLNFSHRVGVFVDETRLYSVHGERARYMVNHQIAKVSVVKSKKRQKMVVAIQISERASDYQKRSQRRNGEAGDFCTAASVRHIDVEHKIACCGGKPDCCLCGGTGFRTDKQRALGYEPKPIHSDDSWAFVPPVLREAAA